MALGAIVYLWNATTETVSQLLELPEGSYVSSLSWAQKGKYLAIAVDNGDIQVILFIAACAVFSNSCVVVGRAKGEESAYNEWS